MKKIFAILLSLELLSGYYSQVGPLFTDGNVIHVGGAMSFGVLVNNENNFVETDQRPVSAPVPEFTTPFPSDVTPPLQSAAPTEESSAEEEPTETEPPPAEFSTPLPSDVTPPLQLAAPTEESSSAEEELFEIGPGETEPPLQECEKFTAITGKNFLVTSNDVLRVKTSTFDECCSQVDNHTGSFSYTNGTCTYHSFWADMAKNDSSLAIANDVNDDVLYVRNEKPDCQPPFRSYYLIGCLYFSDERFTDYEKAVDGCVAVGGALYEPRNLNELTVLLKNVTLNFESYLEYWVNLKRVNDAWIWPETNLIQPLGPDYWSPYYPTSLVNADCGFLSTKEKGRSGKLYSRVCTMQLIEVLCTPKDENKGLNSPGK